MNTASPALDINQWKTAFLVSIHPWKGKACDLSKPGVDELMETPYNPEFAKAAGHDLILSLLQRGGKPQSGENALIARLIADGADWYIALRQMLASDFEFLRHSIYLGAKAREPDPSAEFAMLIEAAAPDGLGPIAGSIIKTLGENWVMAYAIDADAADRVYQIEPLSYLRDLISPAILASSLEADLGL
jgi:hypothetical protein